jgi:hypothetical protein
MSLLTEKGDRHHLKRSSVSPQKKRSDSLKISVVNFPSKSGPLSSQKLIGFPSKKFDTIISKIQFSLFPRRLRRSPLATSSLSPPPLCSDTLTNSDVTFPSETGLLSSQKFIHLPSKNLIRYSPKLPSSIFFPVFLDNHTHSEFRLSQIRWILIIPFARWLGVGSLSPRSSINDQIQRHFWSVNFLTETIRLSIIQTSYQHLKVPNFLSINNHAPRESILNEFQSNHDRKSQKSVFNVPPWGKEQDYPTV